MTNDSVTTRTRTPCYFAQAEEMEAWAQAEEEEALANEAIATAPTRILTSPSMPGNGKGRGAEVGVTPRTLSYSPSWPGADAFHKEARSQTPDHKIQDPSFG